MHLVRHTPRGLTPWFDFDRLFEGFLPPLRGRVDGSSWSPAVDIYEDEKKIVLKADLPEVEEKNLNVKVEDDVLTVHAERKFEKETKEENFHRIERSHGSFHRRFQLPETVNVDKIDAKYDKGVLKITLPKREEKPKKGRVIDVH